MLLLNILFILNDLIKLEIMLLGEGRFRLAGLTLLGGVSVGDVVGIVGLGAGLVEGVVLFGKYGLSGNAGEVGVRLFGAEGRGEVLLEGLNGWGCPRISWLPLVGEIAVSSEFNMRLLINEGREVE